MSELPKGIIPPVSTPLNEDQHVDEVTFKRAIQRQIEAGVDALFIGGTAGLGSILTFEDYRKMVEIALDEAPDTPITVGVLEPSTARALERVQWLSSVGVKSFVAVTPFYCDASQDDQLLRHFGALAEATDLEMVAYNIPACTNSVVPVHVMLEMARRGWIKACKDSSADKDYFATLCDVGKSIGLRVYQGNKADFAWLASVGAAGVVPVPANIDPEIYVQAWRKSQQFEDVQKEQAQCDALWESLVSGYDFLSGMIKATGEIGVGTGVLPAPM